MKAECVWEVIAQYLAPLQDVAREELCRLRRERGRDEGLDIGFWGPRPERFAQAASVDLGGQQTNRYLFVQGPSATRVGTGYVS